jgi:hypothetical protein
MWYRVLDRTKPILRTYRKSNLSFGYYNQRWVPQKIMPNFIVGITRMAKSWPVYKFAINFFLYSVIFSLAILLGIPTKKQKKTKLENEVTNVQLLAAQKNEFGASTKIFHSIEKFLNFISNSQIVQLASTHGNKLFNSKAIEDGILGLQGDMTEEDLKAILNDYHEEEKISTLMFPSRHPFNYPKTDDLSIYKIKKNTQ